MSAREVQAREQLDQWATEHDGTVAHLQLGDPSLSRELTRLADLQVERVVLGGLSRGPLAPAVAWRGRIEADGGRERAGRRPELGGVPAVGGADGRVRPLLGLTRPVTG